MYLLDTHILIWALLDPSRLTTPHRNLLKDPNIQKVLSTVSVWEISLKYGLGKLDLGSHTPEEFLDAALGQGFHVITPDPNTFATFHQLKINSIHKDPFDRMLIWHAIQDHMTLLSYDNKMPQYSVQGLKLA